MNVYSASIGNRGNSTMSYMMVCVCCVLLLASSGLGWWKRCTILPSWCSGEGGGDGGGESAVGEPEPSGEAPGAGAAKPGAGATKPGKKPHEKRPKLSREERDAQKKAEKEKRRAAKNPTLAVAAPVQEPTDAL